MTDDIEGSENHEQESGAETHAENDVHEAPSDFEFSDPAEHHVISETESDGYADLSAAQIRPRSPLVPIAAAAGGILLLGIVAWWQLGGSPTPPPMPANSKLPSLAAAQPEMAAVTPRNAASPIQIPQAEIPAPVSAPAAPAPEAAPQAPVPAPVAAATPIPAASETTEARIDALSAHVDILQKMLDQTEQQLSQMNNMIAAAPGASSEAGVKDLQDRLDKIEQELTALIAKQTGRSKAAVQSETMSSAQPAAKHKISQKTAAKSAKAFAKPAEENHWVLRAASPGQAWVASNPTSGSLVELHVGDTVPGIGHVTAIQQNNGAWIVQGTSGTIQ